MTPRIDPLLWLVLLGAIGLLAPHLPLAVIAVVAIALGWRSLHERLGWPLPPRWLLLTLAIASAALVISRFHALWGLDAGASLLVAAAGLKLLETREPRDQVSVLLLSFFLLTSVLLFDQAPVIFAAVALLFWLLIGAWIGVSQPVAIPEAIPGAITGTIPVANPIAWRMRLAGRLLLAGLPFALVLFVLFPRPPSGLWGVQQPGGEAVTGLSDELRPGQFDRLAENPAPAFRVRFEGEIIPPEARYWRVYVMSDFAENDPASWIADSVAPAPRLETLESSRRRYRITLEPTGAHQLPSLAAAVSTPKGTRLDANLIVHRDREVNDRLRYSLTSATDYRLDVGRLSRFQEARYLRTGDRNPRLADLAQDWHSLDPSARVERALDYFRNHAFRYTRSPGRREGGDRADAFLFETRRGYCADYADAFVRLMRAAGVPARVVTGYQGGEVNGDYLVVRQSDAHAWAEVWLTEIGWQRVDPTTTVAPERIETGVAQSMREDASLPDTVRRDPDSLTRQTRLWLEQFDNRWNQYVLGYDGRLQLDLFGWLGLAEGPHWRSALWAIALAGGAWWLTLWGLARRERRRLAGNRTEYLWGRLLDDLDRLGVTRHPEESERAVLARAARALPEAAGDLGRIASLIEAQRYARRGSRRQERLLINRLTNLHRRLWWRARLTRTSRRA